MKILKASEDDLEEILHLQYLAFTSEAQEMNNFQIKPLHQSLDEITIESREGIIFKGIHNDKIVGSIRGYIKNNTVYIQKLIVHPDFRGLGYANKLLSTFEDYFIKKYGKIRFELYTSAISRRNRNLYKKHGYVIFKRETICDGLFVYFEKTI